MIITQKMSCYHASVLLEIMTMFNLICMLRFRDLKFGCNSLSVTPVVAEY